MHSPKKRINSLFNLPTIDNNMKKILLLCSLLTVVFASCDKEDGISMRTERITTGKWYKYAEYVDVGATHSDLFVMLPPCRQDNFYLFSMDKSLNIDEGDTKCGVDDPQTSNAGSWDFQNADTQINISSAGHTTTYDITQMSDTAMTLVLKDNTANSTLTQRYKHIK